MSAPAGQVRRRDREIGRDEIETCLKRLPVGHFATVSDDGSPYVVPNLFVFEDGKIFLHTAADGHFRRNVVARPRICFEASEKGDVYPYGEFLCDLSTSYVSVIGFGVAQVHDDPRDKALFFDRFVAKYSNPAWNQPKSFYPRLDQVTVFGITLDQITGKSLALPPLAEQWPAQNRTKSPGAVAPPRSRPPLA